MIKELNAHSDYGNGTLMPFGAEDGSGHNSPRTFADGLASNQ